MLDVMIVDDEPAGRRLVGQNSRCLDLDEIVWIGEARNEYRSHYRRIGALTPHVHPLTEGGAEVLPRENVYLHLDEIRDTRVDRLQTSTEILEHLLRLLADVALTDDIAIFVDGVLPADNGDPRANGKHHHLRKGRVLMHRVGIDSLNGHFDSSATTRNQRQDQESVNERDQCGSPER